MKLVTSGKYVKKRIFVSFLNDFFVLKENIIFNRPHMELELKVAK